MNSWIQDAGHGGSDPGSIHKDIHEKTWNLEAAKYVNDRLNELGIRSALTRNGDTTISNKQRANSVSNYDRAISHHFNAGGGSGTELIHSIYADGAFETLLKTKIEEAGYPFRRIFTRKYPGSDTRDYYYMNRETGKARVTIVEYDFLDGPNLHKLKDKDYREGLYECVIQSICEEENVDYGQAPKRNQTNETVNGATFYRVVAGSFHDRENAEKRIQELKGAGFESFVDVLHQ